MFLINYRWRNQKGEDIGQRYDKWYSNEPDFADYDSSIRKFSPLTQSAYDACGANPAFNCVVSGAAPNYSPTGRSDGCKISTGDSRCEATTPTGDTTIFLPLKKIKQLTGESKAACMAMLGPDLDFTAQTQNIGCATVSSSGTCNADYNPGSLMFNMVENSNLNLGYKKWIDVNCATKTNSLMCEMIGKHLKIIHKIDRFIIYNFLSISILLLLRVIYHFL